MQHPRNNSFRGCCREKAPLCPLFYVIGFVWLRRLRLLLQNESIGQVLLQTPHVVLHLRGRNLGINLRRSDVFMAQHHGHRLQRHIFGQSKRRGESMSPAMRREILVDARPGCEFFQRFYHAVAVLDRKNPVFGQFTRITPVLLDKL